LVDAYVGADYRFTKRVAVGLAYDNVTMKSATKERLDGKIDWATTDCCSTSSSTSPVANAAEHSPSAMVRP